MTLVMGLVTTKIDCVKSEEWASPSEATIHGKVIIRFSNGGRIDFSDMKKQTAVINNNSNTSVRVPQLPSDTLTYMGQT
jgi:hypothetical protein